MAHLEGIDTVIVRVTDIKRSVQWYVEKLGLSVIWEDESIRLAVLDTRGPTSLTLWQTDAAAEPEEERSTYPIFKTADAAAAREALMAAGVRSGPLVTDQTISFFRFYDDDGNVLEACQVHGQ